MKDAVRSKGELCRLLDLPAELGGDASDAMSDFPLFVPRGFVARMRPGDPDDPLLRQVLPVAAESKVATGFVVDPVRDAAAERQPGLLQKYAGRALLVMTGACAINCRYCFRRHYPYGEAPRALDEWQPAIDEIAADDSIEEVILSGGDPLTLVDGVLAEFVERLDAIPHLRRLRIHTRLPIVIPERVTDELTEILHATRLTPVVVLHANHARELDEHVAGAMAKLAASGALLFNQAVLLRGVNDSLESQFELCKRLVELRVIPYYLHQLDRVAGAAHFEVPIEKGRRIVAALRSLLPGYAVPRYVQEIAGAASKAEIV
jgi:EF-P beta-lysylation protein EpmB